MQACEECLTSSLKKLMYRLEYIVSNVKGLCGHLFYGSPMDVTRKHVCKELCQLSATICDTSAVECAKFQDVRCQQCANYCRQCAGECRKMTTM